MGTWVWALLLKGLIGIALVWLYYVFVYKGSHFLGRFIRSDAVYDFLFRERGRYDAGYGTPPSEKRRNRANDLRTLPGRERR